MGNAFLKKIFILFGPGQAKPRPKNFYPRLDSFFKRALFFAQSHILSLYFYPNPFIFQAGIRPGWAARPMITSSAHPCLLGLCVCYMANLLMYMDRLWPNYGWNMLGYLPIM